MHIRPWEYEELQPSELMAMIDGVREREKYEDMRRAYFASVLVSPHVSKPISARDIYEPLHPKTDAEIKAELIERRAKADEDKKALLEQFKGCIET